MKNEKPAEDILSGYLDGELSPAEVEQVERALAKSEKARRRLEELRQVSQLLQDLPALSLPTDFSQQVLQAAERRMLLPESIQQAAGGATETNHTGSARTPRSKKSAAEISRVVEQAMDTSNPDAASSAGGNEFPAEFLQTANPSAPQPAASAPTAKRPLGILSRYSRFSVAAAAVAVVLVIGWITNRSPKPGEVVATAPGANSENGTGRTVTAKDDVVANHPPRNPSPSGSESTAPKNQELASSSASMTKSESVTTPSVPPVAVANRNPPEMPQVAASRAAVGATPPPGTTKTDETTGERTAAHDRALAWISNWRAQYVQTAEPQLAVLRVRTSDPAAARTRLLSELSQLLAADEKPTEKVAESAGDAAGEPKSDQKADAAELLAVLVELGPSQMEAVLTTMIQAESNVDLASPTEPVVVAALPDSLRQSLQLPETMLARMRTVPRVMTGSVPPPGSNPKAATGASGRPKPAGKMTPGGKAPPAQKAPPTRKPAATNKSKAASSPAKKGTASDEPAAAGIDSPAADQPRTSWQSLSVPADWMSSLFAQTKRTNPATDDQNAGPNPLEGASPPVLLLFVFEQQMQADEKPPAE